MVSLSNHRAQAGPLSFDKLRMTHSIGPACHGEPVEPSCVELTWAYFSSSNPHSFPLSTAGTPLLIHTGIGAPFKK